MASDPSPSRSSAEGPLLIHSLKLNTASALVSRIQIASLYALIASREVG